MWRLVCMALLHPNPTRLRPHQTCCGVCLSGRDQFEPAIAFCIRLANFHRMSLVKGAGFGPSSSLPRQSKVSAIGRGFRSNCLDEYPCVSPEKPSTIRGPSELSDRCSQWLVQMAGVGQLSSLLLRTDRGCLQSNALLFSAP